MRAYYNARLELKQAKRLVASAAGRDPLAGILVTTDGSMVFDNSHLPHSLQPTPTARPVPPYSLDHNDFSDSSTEPPPRMPSIYNLFQLLADVSASDAALAGGGKFTMSELSAQLPVEPDPVHIDVMDDDADDGGYLDRLLVDQQHDQNALVEDIPLENITKQYLAASTHPLPRLPPPSAAGLHFQNNRPVLSSNTTDPSERRDSRLLFVKALVDLPLVTASTPDQAVFCDLGSCKRQSFSCAFKLARHHLSHTNEDIKRSYITDAHRVTGCPYCVLWVLQNTSHDITVPSCIKDCPNVVQSMPIADWDARRMKEGRVLSPPRDWRKSLFQPTGPLNEKSKKPKSKTFTANGSSKGRSVAAGHLTPDVRFAFHTHLYNHYLAQGFTCAFGCKLPAPLEENVDALLLHLESEHGLLLDFEYSLDTLRSCCGVRFVILYALHLDRSD